MDGRPEDFRSDDGSAASPAGPPGPVPAPAPVTVEAPAAPWTAGEIDRLRILWRAGLALKEIARRLGKGPEAVRSRARRLGLPARRPRGPAPAAPGRPRPCLSCGARFLSEGPHNRLCDPCRQGGAGDFRVLR